MCVCMCKYARARALFSRFADFPFPFLLRVKGKVRSIFEFYSCKLLLTSSYNHSCRFCVPVLASVSMFDSKFCVVFLHSCTFFPLIFSATRRAQHNSRFHSHKIRHKKCLPNRNNANNQNEYAIHRDKVGQSTNDRLNASLRFFFFLIG